MASEKELHKFQTIPSTDTEEVKELLKSMRTCIDQEERGKWILEGEKYEEHEEEPDTKILSNKENLAMEKLLKKILEDQLKKTRKKSGRATSSKRTDLQTVTLVNIVLSPLVLKEYYLYALVLPNNEYLVLRHIDKNWFRAISYFTDHASYSKFLNIFFTNFMYP
ncbi:hypothetical protein GLOIN_2v1488768 [Rhizophagus clarus]|uniref:Uncharacterized protein n=1 Tax=Rhizophagus clarus TaxID=94130 RepID=A0A8H3L1K6_9GLOM|nr:hypothetical protein GLOIN_2v1488768 [Rhizophagus clarus]